MVERYVSFTTNGFSNESLLSRVVLFICIFVITIHVCTISLFHDFKLKSKLLSFAAKQGRMRSTNRNSFNSELELLRRVQQESTSKISQVEKNRKTDFILVYTQTSDAEKIKIRETYEANLENRDLQLEHVPSTTVW